VIAFDIWFWYDILRLDVPAVRSAILLWSLVLSKRSSQGPYTSFASDHILTSSSMLRTVPVRPFTAFSNRARQYASRFRRPRTLHSNSPRSRAAGCRPNTWIYIGIILARWYLHNLRQWWCQTPYCGLLYTAFQLLHIWDAARTSPGWSIATRIEPITSVEGSPDIFVFGPTFHLMISCESGRSYVVVSPSQFPIDRMRLTDIRATERKDAHDSIW